MRVSLSLLVAAISLGIVEAQAHDHLRHSYQNIFYFLAYRLDLYSAEADRIIGVKCASADYKTHKCLDPPAGSDKYKHCNGTVDTLNRGTTIKKTCSLRKFLSHVSGNKGPLKGEPLDGGDVKDSKSKTLLGRKVGENSLDFEVDIAANRMTNYQIGDWPTPEYCMVKDDAKAYLPSLEKMARRVGEVKQAMSAEELTQNDYIFKKLHETVDAVALERRADHENTLVDRLNTRLSGFKVSTLKTPEGRLVLDWDRTVERLKTGAQNEVTFRVRYKRLKDTLNEYKLTDNAKKHMAPLT